MSKIIDLIKIVFTGVGNAAKQLCAFIQTCAEAQPQLVGTIIIILVVYGIIHHVMH